MTPLRCARRFAQWLVVLATCAFAVPLSAQVDFGDDASQWARDGECDDPRFEGEGAAETLLDEDRGHDASDCRSLYAEGRIALHSAANDAIDFGDDESQWARDGECDDPRFAGEGAAETLIDADLYHDATDCRTLLNQGRVTVATTSEASRSAPNGGRVERGWLQSGDATLTSGEFADTYTFEGTRGGQAVIDLRSGEFDPYLLVRAPDGEQFENDDYEGDASRSLLSLDLDQDGTYRITVTSYGAGETGGYTVEITLSQAERRSAPIDRRGTLQVSDDTLQSGEYVDSYDFDGIPGQHVEIDLSSDDFDTYLILVDPSGEQIENDDAESSDDVGHSAIETDLTETGTHRVLVTSYEAGEAGSYRLKIDRTQSGSPEDAPPRRDVTTLTVGHPTSGRLEDGDQELDSGEFGDLYVFDGTAGQTVHVEMASTDFDTFLGLVTPAEEAIENDDFDGSTDRSVVELTLPETGRYRIVATSYAAAESGAYRLTLSTSAAEVPVARHSTGRVYGIFAGISDYPGEGSDLDYTADDATRIRDALMRGAGMRAEDAFTLVDADATKAGMRDAMSAIAARIHPEDTFVLFYSGHGNRLPRDDGFESFDPDGLDETIDLYDGPMRDDELRTLFDGINAHTTLIFLDSCFSGGFAKDIISVPGRMGIFSSEEDVTSQVAAKFRAGGFLSQFLDEGIAQGLADEDKNGSVTALELSQFVHERYRSDVKGPPTQRVRTQGPQSGYQHLVIDRGSIGPFDVLFER